MATQDVDLAALASSARAGLSAAQDEAALEAWRIAYLGRKGRLTLVLRRPGELPIEERRRLGAEANRLKDELESVLEARRQELAERRLAATVETGRLDVTLPGRPKRIGRLHPVTQTLREMLDCFVSMGFSVLEGPEAKCARAVARAQRTTGAAITTHTSGSARFEIAGGNCGMAFLDLFEAEGVDPRRVIIGHTDENADIRNLVALCRRGAFVQFDVIGKSHWMLDETRADLAAALIERGFEGHLLLSTDRNRAFELRVNGGTGYAHMLTAFMPMVRARGVSEAVIHKLLVENPRRALAFG